MGVLANPDSNQAMVPSKQKRTHAVFCVSSAHRLAPTSKPRFVGEKVKLGELLLNTFSGEWGTEEGELLTPVLRTSNFNEDGSLNYSTPAMRCIPEGKVAKKRMVRGDIILEKSGGTPKRPVGIMAFYDSDALALCSKFNQVLRFDESRILPRFAFHQLRWLKDRNAFDRYTRKTTGLQNLQMKKLIELKLRVPQIEAQTSIATTLDEIVCDQRTLQQEIACLDSLVKSRFVEMFGDPALNPKGWSTQNLKALGELKNGINFKSVDNGFEIKCLGVGDFKGRYAIKDMSLVSDVSLSGEPNANQLLQDGDVIFVRSNGNKALVGRCLAIFPGGEKVTFSGFCIRFRNASEELELNYLLNCLKTDSMRKAMTGRGASIQNLSQSLLSKLEVPLPPLALQQDFAAFASQVDKSRFVRDHEMNFR